MNTSNLTKQNRTRRSMLLPMVMSAILLCATSSAYAILVSLKTVPTPLPLDLNNYIANTVAAERLGKALFWDEQLSANDRVACGTCHEPFAGGGDARVAANPGPDRVFGNEDDTVGSPGVPRTRRAGSRDRRGVPGR